MTHGRDNLSVFGRKFNRPTIPRDHVCLLLTKQGIFAPQRSRELINFQVGQQPNKAPSMIGYDREVNIVLWKRTTINNLILWGIFFGTLKFIIKMWPFVNCVTLPAGQCGGKARPQSCPGPGLKAGPGGEEDKSPC